MMAEREEGRSPILEVPPLPASDEEGDVLAGVEAAKKTVDASFLHSRQATAATSLSLGVQKHRMQTQLQDELSQQAATITEVVGAMTEMMGELEEVYVCGVSVCSQIQRVTIIVLTVLLCVNSVWRGVIIVVAPAL